MAEVVVTQLVVDASGAKEGVDDFVAAMDKAKAVAVSGGDITASAFERAQQRWVQSLAATDPVIKAQIKMQQALAAQQQINTDAVKLGIATQDAANAQMDAVRTKYQGYIDKVKEGGAAHHDFASAVNLAKEALGAFGIALSVAGLVNWGKQIFANTAVMVDQATQVGLTTTALQVYRNVLQDNGGNVDALNTFLQKLSRTLGEAQAGSIAARTEFNALGVNWKTLATSSDPVQAAVQAVSGAIMALPTASARAQAEFQFFGLASKELGASLHDLSGNFDDLATKYEVQHRLMGVDLPADAKKAADEINKAMSQLQITAAPSIVALADALVELIKRMHEFTDEDWESKFKDVAKAYASVFGGGALGLAVNLTAPSKPSASSGGFNPFPSQPIPTDGISVAPQNVYSGLGSTDNIDHYVAQLKLAASLASQSATEKAKEQATIAAAEALLKDEGKDQATIITSYKQAKDVLTQQFGSQKVADIEHYAALQQQGDAFAKLKDTFDKYLAGLVQAAQLAGEAPAQREEELAVIKAADVLQKERGVTEKDLTQNYADALDILQKAGVAQAVLNALQETRDNQLKLENASGQDNLDILNSEITLIGKSNLEQATAIALLREKQALTKQYGNQFDPTNPTKEQKDALDLAMAQAAATVKLTEATDAYNKSLSYQADLLSEIDANARNAASGMADSFGKMGKAIGGVAVVMTDYAAQQAGFAEQQAALNKLAADGQDVTQAQTLLDQKAKDAEVNYYGDMIQAAKGFFSEKSGIYKALNEAEGIYRAIQLAGSIKGIATEAAETATSIAHAATQATAWAITAIAKAFASVPFPYNIVAGAVTAAALVAAGVELFGGGGGSSGGSAPVMSAQDQQAAQGAGTVLGDPAAKSDSIAHSLDQLAKDTNKDLEYSNQMVTSLKAIQNSIGSLSSLLAQQLGVGGIFNTDSLNLGTVTQSKPISSYFFDTPFGDPSSKSTETRTLIDQGINIAATTIGNAIAKGIQANSYQTIQVSKDHSYAFGLIDVKSTKNKTTTADLSSDLEQQITGIIGSLRDTVVNAATKLGVSGAEAAINAFTIDIGKISFKDMTAQQISDTLNAVFSKLGDEMAAAAVPVVTQLQQVGEGSLETLSRLINEYTAVDDVLAVMGKTFGPIGVNSLAARDRLVQLAGGLDEFTKAGQDYADEFLTDAQKLVPIQAAVSAEMARLGESGVTTKDQFVALVQSIDVSTDAGAQLYTALMNVAPAFGKVADAAQALADQRRDMEIKLLQDTGDAAGALALQRQKELEALDASLVPLQEQIYAAEDAATAADALAKAQADQAASAAAAAAAAKATADFNANIQDQIQKITDPGLAAYNEMIATQTQRIADATAAGADLSAVYQLNALEQQNFADAQAKAAADTAAAAAKATSDFNANIQDQTLKITDPNLAAYNEMLATQAQRLADAAAVGGDLNAVLQLNTLEQQQYADQQAQAAAAAQKALDDQRTDLQIKLMQDTGDAAGALALQRQKELAALDPSLVALQNQIYAAEDAATAADNLAKAQADEATAAKAAADALKATADFNAGLADSILKITDPVRATVEELLSSQAKRLSDAQAVSGNIAQVEALNAAETTALVGGYVKTLQQFTAGLKATDDYQSGLAQINQAMADGEEAASVLGQSIGSIADAANAAKSALAGKFNTDIGSQLEAIIDPVRGQYDQLVSGQKQRLTDAQALGANIAEVQKLNAAELEKFLLGLSDAERAALGAELGVTQNAVFRLADAIGNLNTQLTAAIGVANDAAQQASNTASAWATAQDNLTKTSKAMLVSDASLSPVAAYQNAKSQFDQLRSAALGGDAQAASDLASFASTFLQSSLAFNGSTQGYGADFATVQQTLAQVSSFAGDQQSLAQQQMVQAQATAKALQDIQSQIATGAPNLAVLQSQLNASQSMVAALTTMTSLNQDQLSVLKTTQSAIAAALIGAPLPANVSAPQQSSSQQSGTDNSALAAAIAAAVAQAVAPLRQEIANLKNEIKQKNLQDRHAA